MKRFASAVVFISSLVFGLISPAYAQQLDGRPLSYWAAQLDDLSESTQFNAAFRLGRCGPPCASVLPNLRAKLADQNVGPRAKYGIASAILQIDQTDEQDVIEYLIGVLDSEIQRGNVFLLSTDLVQAIGNGGPRSRAAIPLLMSIRQRAPGSLGLRINQALEKIQGHF